MDTPGDLQQEADVHQEESEKLNEAASDQAAVDEHVADAREGEQP